MAAVKWRRSLERSEVAESGECVLVERDDGIGVEARRPQIEGQRVLENSYMSSETAVL